jgi:hypothetical protein
MKHCMIDIETLSTDDSAVILSIGARMFNMRGEMGEGVHWALDINDQQRRGRKIDGETVKWWAAQNDAARRSWAVPTPYRLMEAMIRFDQFIMRNTPDRVWAKPPQFDIKILRSAWGNVYTERPFPVHHRQESCLRTLLAVYNGTFPEHMKNNIAHDALEDATFQAQQAAHCWQWIRGRR